MSKILKPNLQYVQNLEAQSSISEDTEPISEDTEPISEDTEPISEDNEAIYLYPLNL